MRNGYSMHRLGSKAILTNNNCNHQENRKLVALPVFGNPLYFNYLIDIYNASESCCGKTTFLILPLPDSNEKLFPRSYEVRQRYAQKYFLDKIGKFPNIEILFVTLPDFRTPTYRNFQNAQIAGDIFLIDSNYKYLNQSVASYLSSDLARSSYPQINLDKFRRGILNGVKAFIVSAEATSSAIAKYRPSEIIFINGRYPGQAGVRESAELHSIPWSSVEHGGEPGKAYFREQFLPQDRIQSQIQFDAWSKNLNGAEKNQIESWANNWLAAQRSNIRQNPFVRTSQNQDLNTQDLSNTVPIFTSSIDEGIGIPSWGNDEISSLVEKTVFFAKIILDLGMKPIVVIHPNTLNKTWIDFKVLTSRLDKNNIEYVLPWTQISSYDLLEAATFVCTWRSTIGLEAAAVGKPIVVLTDTHYDLSIPVIHCPKNSSELMMELESYLPDPLRAKFLLYFSSNRGHAFDRNTWSIELIRISDEIYRIIPLGGFMKSIRNRTHRFIPIFLPFRHSPNRILKFLKPLVGERLSVRYINFLLQRYS